MPKLKEKNKWINTHTGNTRPCDRVDVSGMIEYALRRHIGQVLTNLPHRHSVLLAKVQTVQINSRLRKEFIVL